MLILFVSIVIFVICIILAGKNDYIAFGTIGATASFTVITLIVLGLVFNPVMTKSAIIRFKSVQTTVDIARSNGISLEDAGLILKVIDKNQWLASAQYYNSLWFWGDFIPDEVNQLSPIK